MNKELEANTTISHYHIISKLGAGGMGEVFLAEDTLLRRQVALKVLPESFAMNVEGLRRFEREAHSASALNHPNILTIYEFGADGETHFLAAEYVKGETLRQRLKGESLSLRETLDIAAQVAAALNAAHSAGIVHRDIKPENIMLRDDGLVKVLDFGLAKLTKSKPSAEDVTQIQVQTSAGQILGTALYMSPEQARGKEVLNPNYATAHHWLALNHLNRNRFDDALNEMKRAQELDPLSPIIGSTLAMVYLLKNNPDLAVEQCKRVIELEPNFPSAHLYLGWSYTKLGRNEEAIAELEKAVEFSGRAGFYLADLGYLYAVNGRRKEALAILKELQEKNAKSESSFESVAAVYAGLGEKDQVFAWLEKGFQAHDDLTNALWWFVYDDLHSDPRHTDLVRRMGL